MIDEDQAAHIADPLQAQILRVLDVADGKNSGEVIEPPGHGKAQKSLTKGMFLMPQHFQAQDEYFEQALHFRLSASSFANWGLSGIGIDEASLVNGLFTLRHCEGVMPDGLMFEMPASDELPGGRPVGELFAPTQQTLEVYLAIPQTDPSAKNIGIAAKAKDAPNGASTRYLAETRSVMDATMGTEEKAIQVEKKSFRLLFGGESLERLYHHGRIAQISRSPAELYVLSPKFIPPLLIVASDYLMMLARRQVEVLTAKSASVDTSAQAARARCGRFHHHRGGELLAAAHGELLFYRSSSTSGKYGAAIPNGVARDASPGRRSHHIHHEPECSRLPRL